jgi:hypothetical protein
LEMNIKLFSLHNGIDIITTHFLETCKFIVPN